MLLMRIALFDIAGTIVDGNPWLGFLKHPAISRVRVYTMYPLILGLVAAKKLSFISDVRFRQLWVRQMARLLRGLSRQDTDTIFRWIVAEHMREKYRPDILARLQDHAASGDTIVLVSGMFTPLTQAFADHVGATVGLGTHLVFAGEICVGTIEGPVCAGDVKVSMVRDYLAQQAVNLKALESTAYTDSASDASLLAFAHKGFATYPDPELRLMAESNGWQIIS
jgi:HAD superfamily hydrolase (TIGR01490 family)